MNFATLQGLTIPEGNVVKIESNGITLWELLNDVKLDVFFDFRTVGDISAPSGKGFTLENQGTDTAVTLEAATCTWTDMEISQDGLTSSLNYTSIGANNYHTGGIRLIGVNNELVAGAKTIVFCLSSANPRSKRNASILAPNDVSKASLGVGASDSGQPYHAYARQVGGGDYGLARAVDTDYSVDGSYFAWFGGTKSTERKCVVITTGSASEPSPTKIYVDGVLVGVFDIADQEMQYMDLTSSDNIIRGFTSMPANSSSTLNAQDWFSYTLAYFGMTQGEMSERDIQTLSAKFGACTSISLDYSTLNFTDITPKQLTATVTPKQTYDSVVWSSSNTAVASVSADGIVSPESVGKCTITATCGEYSASCNVSVAEGFDFLYDWDFTESLTDKRSGMTATVSGATQDGNGLTFSAENQCCGLGAVMAKGRRIEIDVASMELTTGTSVNHGFVMWGSGNTAQGALLWTQKNQKWGSYNNGTWKLFTLANLNEMSGKTVTIDIDANGYAELFINGVSYGKTSADVIGAFTEVCLGYLGSTSNGGNMSTTTIAGLRIYKI